MKKTVLALSLLLSASTVQAGWVDDWLDQSSTTSAGYFEGQQRGYYSAGSFNGRWKSDAAYPVTIEMPRVKSGCGGIDVFMGGMSFMDTDHLSEKLQHILTNAGAVAFDLALKTLCEQCSNTIKNIEAIVNELNSMQLDDCAAAKGLVGIVADENGIRSAEEMQERLSTAIKENKLVSASNTMWYDLTQEEKDANGEVTPEDVKDLMTGCSDDVKDIFLNGKTLLGSLGKSDKLDIPVSHLNLIRGLVGDVKMEGENNQYTITAIDPCPENTPESLKSFLDGTVYVKNESGTCSAITDTNKNLVEYYGKMLSQIATKIEGNSAGLSTDEQDFLNSNPLSPLPILKSAVATRTTNAAVGGLANITAKAHTLQMLTDLYKRGEVIGLKGQEILANANKANVASNSKKCAIYLIADDAGKKIDSMLKKIDQLREAANASYIAATSEMNTVLTYMEHMQRTEHMMHAELTHRYGKDMAARLM